MYESEPTTPICHLNTSHVTESTILMLKYSILNLHREVPAAWVAQIRSEKQSSCVPSAGVSHSRRRVRSRTRHSFRISARG
jgi:hypothetical protein